MTPTLLRALLCVGFIAGCSAPATAPLPSLGPVEEPAQHDSDRARARFEAFELVETAPLETTLDHEDLRATDEVWLEMIDGADERVDLAHFYASDRAGSRLERVVEALERAAERGVEVRFLSEASFQETYPETLARLGAHPRIETRAYDLRPLTGGVLHAKYMLIDGREAFLGSANFDWRSLEHVQELGVRLRARASVQAMAAVFEADWALAEGRQDTARPIEAADTHAFPEVCDEDGERLRVTPLFSPRELVPDERLWDLPRLVETIDAARESVCVQLLSYRVRVYGGGTFDELDGALRRAAQRGVRVRLMLADWAKRRGTIEALQDLEPLPDVEVRLVTLPEAAEGFIPFARVVHAKYMVVDGEISWLGTSNWEKGYFYDSRNVGLLVDSPAIGARLVAFFDDLWTSEYAEPVDPTRRYEPPRIGE